MEVSAHAIVLKKVCAIKFDALVFTNCTEDHLDYFETMENYGAVKKSIFVSSDSKMIVNTDDALGREIAALKPKNVVTYGIFNPSDVFAALIKEGLYRTRYVINIFDDIYEADTALLGRFNVYNALAAVTCAYLLGVPAVCSVAAVNAMTAVGGRMERIFRYRGADIFIDYAHTPDGLEKSLLYLRKVTTGELKVLFGCGGNRDAKKRPLMGKTAGDIADFVIITSDNPRFEDPLKIIREAEAGVREATRDYIAIKDRREAIAYALKTLEDGDCLLIAGKGTENYQEIMGVKHSFSDKEVVGELISENA